MINTDMQQLKQEFEDCGYLHLKGFFDGDEIAEIKQHLADYIENVAPILPPEHVFYEDEKDKSSIKQMFYLSNYDPFFEKWLRGSKIEKMAELLLGEKMGKGFVEYFNKPPKIGKPTPPHQDGYYFMLEPQSAITFWIPLEDVDEENGCLKYVAGSNKLPMREHGRSEILGFSQGIVDYGTEADLKDEVSVPAVVGDVLTHHSMTIHSANANQSETRSRTVLGMVYFGESAKEDIEAKKAYQEKLKKETIKS
ncbi:phytanoyl-CoA dioxygenase family protein [Membranihabitans marinus]|uniref:phytanoyl-CoA dioxygenase family protein n=1 Tax=Membranihabitans marinus TaxID=1227546 RepID=UPI001F1F2E8D|nr:phytanoyl-CoA dioxygenase family protein [Membranihabitans marinus]